MACTGVIMEEKMRIRLEYILEAELTELAGGLYVRQERKGKSKMTPKCGSKRFSH